MAVVVETTLGDFTVDLFTERRPRTCLNFLKLCKLKAFNNSLFFSVKSRFVAMAGDETNTGRGGESFFRQLYGEQGKCFEAEPDKTLKHARRGLVSMVNGAGENEQPLHGSQFFVTLSDELSYLDAAGHSVFGELVEGLDIVDKLNALLVDAESRPFQDVVITHTVVLHDPFDDPNDVVWPDQSPKLTAEVLKSQRIGACEEIDEWEGLSSEQVDELIKEREAKERALVLEMVGDLPTAEVAPPDNVLFVCKLNPATEADDLEVIFSRFGEIVSCEVIRDRRTGESLQYAFIEFKRPEDCEKAYFKMDNVLVDDRRIHVDFSQSVSRLKFESEANRRRERSERPVQRREEGSRRRSRDRRDSRREESSSRRREKRRRSASSERRDRRKERHRDDRRSRDVRRRSRR